jgi:hypothetical protein
MQDRTRIASSSIAHLLGKHAKFLSEQAQGMSLRIKCALVGVYPATFEGSSAID